MSKVPRDPLARFMEKVHKSPKPGGCWLWAGALSHNGYGFFKATSTRQVKAHRFAHEAFVGPIPAGLCVLHRCDTPACVNPKHLFLGTAKQNQADMTRKGRGRIGARNGWARLTEDEVRTIRRLYIPIKGGRPKGVRLREEVAARFGISGQQVHRIVTRQVWGHVPDD